MAYYYEELNRYYNERLQWLDLLPKKRMEIQKKIDNIKNEAWHLYERMDIPVEYQNQKAVDHIQKQIESTNCTLQLAYEEYEKYKKLEKQKAEKELERKRRIEEEERRRRIERSQRLKEQWDREEEEQERARARAYDEKYGKKDLLGSTVCIKRFQTSPLDLKHSCRFCPHASKCTRA